MKINKAKGTNNHVLNNISSEMALQYLYLKKKSFHVSFLHLSILPISVPII